MLPLVERRRDGGAVRRILTALPGWFGIPAAIDGYVRHADDDTYRSYLAVRSGRTIGVALVERHCAESAELHLIAVAPDSHRSGAGTALLSRIEHDLRADGVLLFQVHTVGPSYHSPEYAATRAFYRARGFLPLQELDGIDWPGPTLIMVKPLAP